jgi:hypothetical protein
LLESAFILTEIIDFRVNQRRNLPDSLVEITKKGIPVKFTKTHFFLMREASDDYIFSQGLHDCRGLEKDIWEEYIGGKYNFKRITAYHWKESELHSDFGIFSKFRSFHAGWWTLLAALIIIGLGILGSVIGSCIRP